MLIKSDLGLSQVDHINQLLGSMDGMLAKLDLHLKNKEKKVPKRAHPKKNKKLKSFSFTSSSEIVVSDPSSSIR
jgi:hypothetical protein